MMGRNGSGKTTLVKLLLGEVEPSRGVVFARMSMNKPHLLILDEPTNHLDIYSIDALTDGLQKYGGGVIVISHNQSLLKKLAQETFFTSKKDKTVKHFPAGVEAYIE